MGFSQDTQLNIYIAFGTHLHVGEKNRPYPGKKTYSKSVDENGLNLAAEVRGKLPF